MNTEEQLTERITVRFTKAELSQFERLAKREGDHKTSTFIRRILAQFLNRQDALGKVDAGGVEIAGSPSISSTQKSKRQHGSNVVRSGFRGEIPEVILPRKTSF